MAQLIPVMDPNAQPSLIHQINMNAAPALLQKVGPATNTPAPGAPPMLQKVDVGGMAPLPDVAGPTPPMVKTLTPLQQNIASDQGQLQKVRTAEANPWGTPDNHPGTFGKIAHVLSVAGNIAGDIVAPNVMSNIPGTQRYMQAQDTGYTNRLNTEQDQESQQDERDAQTANLNLQPQLHQQQLALQQEKQNEVEDKDQNTHALQLARTGQVEITGADGQKHIVDDPGSQVYQSRKALTDYHGSQMALDNAKAELAQAGNNPQSPAYQLALGKLHVAQQNALAASERASAYMGNYLAGAYNKGLDGNVLPGAPQINDGSGNITTVGTKNAQQAVKAQANAAQFNDVHGALDNLEGAARSLVQSGGSLNSVGVIYALQHAQGGTFQDKISSLDKANLTPAERNYVMANIGAHENVQAMRKSAGGTATDTAVEKLDNMIPGAQTPDLDYLLRQTSQIRQTAERLGTGVTTVKGGAHVPTGQNGSTGGGKNAGSDDYQATATGKDGHQIGFRGGKWYDTQTGKAVQ